VQCPLTLNAATWHNRQTSARFPDLETSNYGAPKGPVTCISAGLRAFSRIVRVTQRHAVDRHHLKVNHAAGSFRTEPAAHRVRMPGDMAIQRMDNVGIVLEDLDAAAAFFAEFGLELEGKGQIEGPWADRTVGLDGVWSEIVMMRAPDGHGKLELTRYHAPAAIGAGRRARRPTRWACVASCSLSMTSRTPRPPARPRRRTPRRGSPVREHLPAVLPPRPRGHHRRPNRADRLTRPCRGDSAHDLTCDTVGGLEVGRLADLLVLLADWPELRTNRGCRVARCRMSGREDGLGRPGKRPRADE
jgi:hypothetical protein